MRAPAAFLHAFTPQEALWREAPCERNILEIVWHVADVERVFGYRALVAFLRGLDAAAWGRRAPPDWTIRSVRAVAYAMAGHERHHLADIRRQHRG